MIQTILKDEVGEKKQIPEDSYDQDLNKDGFNNCGGESNSKNDADQDTLHQNQLDDPEVAWAFFQDCYGSQVNMINSHRPYQAENLDIELVIL